ncbi:hypothetical protein LOTGIDRAFT_131233, partial [Lottia gigantea]
IIIITYLLHIGSNAVLKFAKSYGDHMVLQRGPQRAIVWGFSDVVGDDVTVTISGHGSSKATITKNTHGNGGVWKVKLPAMTDPGPFSITASSKEGSIKIDDVLFGDVWICSGQSNMEFNIHDMFNSSTVQADGFNYDKVRYMKVDHDQQTTVNNDLKHISISWTKPNQATLPWISAICFLFGKNIHTDRKYPIGMVESDWGGTPIETWSSPDALAACPKNRRKSWEDSGCWNAMIEPILPMTITGAIWYQGESNAGRVKYYDCQQQHMIEDWRRRFHDASLGETKNDFYFGYVQLAAFRNANFVDPWASMRWTQTANHGYSPNPDQKNVFMAIAMDLPDFTGPRGPIHPRDKLDVANRLSLAARGVAYKEHVEYQGPFPSRYRVTGKQLVIQYDKPIQVRSSVGFEVCCSTSSSSTCSVHDHWTAASVIQHGDNSGTLDIAGCQGRHLVGVRYAWKETPCVFKKCPVYGKASNLPGPSFIQHGNLSGSNTIIG